ncbi:SdrD B-like domain-containing protein [Botrimarina hoheduenensis]|uniref:SdrD B-like domain-containing protein n=1 Tax=Botrimarina hoheduenensis TaxID=2528000 RepID=UPI0018D4C22C|nr:SdrD B-like domain-containing protein [Botrimarina hoheduenensis]
MWTYTAGQGLLHFTSGATTGAERTGWIDVRHPVTGELDLGALPTDPINTAIDHGSLASVSASTTNLIGYDRSDYFVEVHSNVVDAKYDNGYPGPATPQYARDFDYANQIWAQAGITVLNVGIDLLDLTGPTDVKLRLSSAEQIALQGVAATRDADPSVVNNWYVAEGTKHYGVVYLGGRALSPSGSLTASGMTIFNEADGVAFSHELGHFILNAFGYPPDTRAAASESGHTNFVSDLMHNGGPTPTPTTLKQAAQNTAFLNAGVSYAGLAVEGVPTASPIVAVHNASDSQLTPTYYFVKHTTGNDATYGDRIDFHWVEDNTKLSGAAVTDPMGSGFLNRRPDLAEGTEPLRWGIGGLAPAPSLTGHNLDNWLAGAPVVPAFTGGSFNTVDVFSQVARYADNDGKVKDITSAKFRREAALDYEVFFSADGVSWVAGRVAQVFDDGWTTASNADDYIARWWSPVAAQHVRVQALGGKANDGNAQIDAVVAGVATNVITGTVFQEGNPTAPNGELDTGDKPLKGVLVKLDHATNNALDREVLTDTNGTYAFTDLAPGETYRVVVTKPNATLFTTQGVDTNNLKSHVDGTGQSNPVTVPTVGTISQTVNAGTIDTSGLRKKQLKSLVELLGGAAGGATDGTDLQGSSGSAFVTQSEVALSLVGVGSLPDLPFLGSKLTDAVDLEGLFEQFAAGMSEGVSLGADATPASFTLANDALFGVSINGAAPLVVRVAAAQTTDNTTAGDLAVDLTLALSLAGLSDSVTAVVLDDGRLALESIDGAGVEELSIATLRIKGDGAGIDPDVAQYGQLSATLGAITNLTLEIDGVQYIVPKIGVTPPGVSEAPFVFTQDNASLEDLADDLNAAFLTAVSTLGAAQPLTAVVAAVDPGANPTSTADDRLVLVAVNPEASSIKVVANGARLGFADGVTQTATTNSNPAVTAMGFGVTSPAVSASQGARVIADAGFFSVDTFVEAAVEQMYALSNLPLPAAFDPDPVWNDTTKTLEFNFALNHVFSAAVDLDFFDGFNLGSLLGTLEVAALAQGSLDVQVNLDMRVGFKLGDIGAGFTVTPATPLASLNGGDGVGLLVGMTAANAAPALGVVGSDANFSLAFTRAGGDVENVSLTLPKSPLTSELSLPIDQRTPNTDDNTTVGSLAADLNKLFSQTMDGDGRVLSTVLEAGVFESVASSGFVTRKLTLRAIDTTVLGMTMTGGSQLGFVPVAASNWRDLSVVLSNGAKFDVNLDGVETLGQAMAAIEAASEVSSVPRVDVVINGDTNGLDVIDLTTGAVLFGVSAGRVTLREEQQASAPFDYIATSTIGSPAGLGLGVLGAEENVSANIVEGTPLHGLGLADRLFIVEAAPNHKHLTVTATVAAEFDVTAALGEIALDLNTVDSDPLTFTVEVGVHLTDPDSSGEIFVSEFTPDDLPGIVSATMLAAQGSGSIEVGVNVFDGDDLLDLETLLGESSPAVTLGFAFNTSSGQFQFTADTNFATLWDSFKDLGAEDFVALLGRFVDELRDNPDLGFLGEDVPIINRSLDDVLEFADGLLEATNRLVSGLSLDDLLDVEQARLALETAVANLGMSLEERELLLKQLDVLRRVAAPPDQDAPVDFFDRLPARLLSAVAHFGKLIHQQVPTDVAGYGDLIVAFKDLARQVPAFNSIEDRLADALEDAINDAFDTPDGSPLTVDVRLGFADFDGVTTTALDREDRMIVLGVELAAPQFVKRTLAPQTPITAEVGPITLSLDAELEVVAGGVIAFGLAIDPRQTVDDDRFFLIVDPPSSTTDDLIKTSLDLGLGINSHAEGEAGFGSFGLVDVSAEFTALASVQQVEAPAANIQLDGTPVYYRGSTAHDDDGRSMIVVVKNSTTGDADVLSFSDGEYRLSSGGPPVLEILYSSIDLVTEATEIVIEYQTKGDHAPPTPETPQPNTPGTRVDSGNVDLMRAANHPASFSLQFTPNAPLGNALGAVAFSDIGAMTDVDTDIRGMLLASFDAELFGNDVDNLLVVAASLNHLLQPQVTFDADGLSRLFQLDFDLKTIVAGIDRLLAEIEQAMTESVANLPLAGDGLDIDETFVGKIRNNFTIPFLDFLCNTAGSLDDVEAAVQQFIFEKLGPGGLRLLADRSGNATIDLADVYVDLDENHFDIDVALGGREEFMLDFNFNENFPLQGEGGVKFGWDFAVALGVGVSRTEGFYFLDHQAGAYGLTTTTPELSLVIDAGLSVDTSVPGAPVPTSLELGLFGLSLSATDILSGSNTGTYINGTLTIDVTDDTLDDKIHLSELMSRPLTDVFLASMVATAEVNLKLALGINDNLPSVETDLFIGTDSGSGPGPWTATLDSSTGSYKFTLSDLTIQFRDLGINLGDFLSDHLGSVVRSVDKYIEPIKPVVRLLTTEVPGVSQLSVAAGNGPVDFLDLAFLNNPTAGAKARKFVDTVTTIIDVVGSLASVDPSDNLFVVLDDLIEVPTPGFSLAYASAIEPPEDAEEQFFAALTGGIVNGVQNVQGKLAGLLDRLHEIGVEIHLIEQPTNIVNMILGQPFDVVSWKLPRFDLPFTFEAEFPVIPVPKINVRVGLNANIFADISVGYDSHGLETGNFFHGFYFGDREDVFVGADIDEFGVGVGVTLAALLDLLVVKAGVEGEIRADIFANWRDSDNDGKLHADEIAAIVRNDGIECLFDLHGEVRAIVRAVWEFTITGSTGSKEFINEVLFAFMHECPKYETGHVSEGETLPGIAGAASLDPSFADFNTAGTLVLHAGAYAGLRGPGATSDTSEAFEVEELVPPSVSNGMSGVYVVRALGLESRYSGVKRIYFDGGVGNDRLELIDVTVPVVAFGGAGDDVLHGTKNVDLLDGGGGDDTIFGRGAGDFLFGGAGADVIYGDLEAGNNDTALWGVGAADTIDAGAGDDLVYAGDGGDLVYAGSGDDTVYADLKEAGVPAALQGVDEVHGGAGDDVIYGGGLGDFLYGDAGRDLLFGEGGDDLVEGGTGADLVMGDHGDDTLRGGSGIDVVIGGLGDDLLFGGRGNDVLAGGLGTSSAPLAAAVSAVLLDVDLYADVVARETPDYTATDGDDELWGEEDNDFLVGDDGDDRLFGGWGDDAIVGHRVAEVSALYSEYIEGGPGDDFICAGGGPDEIYGGTADAGLAHILASVPATQSLGGFFLESCESTEVIVTLPPTNASVAGEKFNDLNGDGVRDAGEPVLAGWTINLLDPDGEVIDSAVTDAGGAYAFSSLEPGDYGLSEDSQVDWVQTAGGATLTLADSDEATGYDFGNRFNGATIQGRKWHDVNGDGVFDAGEPGLDNWVIELLDESGAVVASTHTFAIDLDGSGSDGIDNDGDDNPLSNLDDGFTIDEADERFTPNERGFYEFTGLPSGVYAVREVALAGWLQSSPRLTEPGTFVVLPDDGYTALRSDAQSAVPGAVTSVSVTFDIDHALRSDLAIDLIAPSGARVTLLDGVGGSVQNFAGITLSDAATVAIADISANPSVSAFLPAESLASLIGESATGQWTLEVRDNIEGICGRLNDWSIVINGATVNGGAPNLFRAGDTVAVTVAAVAGGVTTENFGNYRPATVTGLKFLDRNGDGQRNADVPGGPEPGLAGVVIYADLNNNGLLDRGEPKTITQLDDPNTQGIDETGQYVLNGLPPGSSPLVIREVVTDGLTPTFPTPIVAGSGIWMVDLTSGQVVEGYDFGNAPAASVHGQKWLDANGNGFRDPSEEGLDGVLIYADLNNNGELDPGEPTSVTHSVASTLPQPGDYNGDGSVNAADYTVWRDSLDGGVPGDLRADGNGDGVVDALDYAVWQQNYGQTAAVVASTGHYWLQDLPAGSVTVREAPYPGLTPTTPIGGAYSLTLAIGEVREGIDFGNAPAASVHGQKWLDANGNGVRDPGEEGLNGVVIYADLNSNGAFDLGEPTSVTHSVTTTTPPLGDYNGDGSVNAADYTVWRDALAVYVPGTTPKGADGDGDGDVDGEDYAVWRNNYGKSFVEVTSDGHYWLDGLPAGEVVIRETPVDGFHPTFPESGFYALSLAIGETREGIDFGNAPNEQQTGSISGVKVFDENGNRLPDDLATPMQGVTIYVDLDSDGSHNPALEPFAVTGADGGYTIQSVPAGTWQVRESVPAGYQQVYPAVPGYHVVTVAPGQGVVGVDFANNGDAALPATEPAAAATAGLVAFWNFENDLIDTAAGFTQNVGAAGDDLVPAGPVNVTYTSGQVGSAVVVSPGAWVSTTMTGDLSLSEFTVEALVQPSQGLGGVIVETQGLASGFDFRVRWANGLVRLQTLSGGSVIAASTAFPMPAGVWSHVAVIGSGVDLSLYVDGAFVDSVAVGAPIGIEATDRLLWGGQEFEGAIDKGAVWSIPLTGAELTDHAMFPQDCYGLTPLGATGEIHGTKFHDTDGDGLRGAAEVGLAGWTITLTGADFNHDGLIDLNDVLTTTTDATGAYWFTDLESATYTVSETQQPGWTQTSIGGFGMGGVLSPAPGTTNWEITLGRQESYFEVDFGNQSTRVASVHGQKWHDANADGKRDPGEVGLDGWVIELYDASGALVTSTVTMSMDVNQDGEVDPISERGLFWFDDVAPGIYTVGEVLVDGWRQTVPSAAGLSQPGDTNQDGLHDLADLARVAEWDLLGSGLAAGWAQGDFNGNGVVDQADLSAALANVGQTSFTAADRRVTVQVGPGQTVAGVEFANYEPTPLPDGDDRIFAQAGDDIVRGDNLVTDPTVISVGTRRDTIYGQGGSDRLFGQEEDDVLWGADPMLGVVGGGVDDDFIHGGEGTDEVRQTVNTNQVLTNTLLTGQGVDTLASIERGALTGGASNNTITAAAFSGPVTLVGLGGNDTLTGGVSGDLLVGGAGDDTLAGGDGDDTYLFGPVTTALPELDTINEGAGPLSGTDTLDFSTLDVGVTVDLSGALPANQIALHAGGGGRQVSVAVAGEEMNLENVVGTLHDDLLFGNAANNVLTALDGSDDVRGGAGNDILHVGPGVADLADGGADDDRIVFHDNWGDATIADSGGFDTVDFSAVTTSLDALVGSLVVTSGPNTVTHAGSDFELILGGQADDVFRFADGATLPPGGRIEAGPGIDLLGYSAYTTGVTVNLTTGAATGAPGGVAEFENVTGGQGGDSLTGDGGANVLDGGLGDDPLLDGRGGNDTLLGGDGDDGATGFLGGDGDDLLIGGHGDDLNLDGGNGDDTVVVRDGDGSDSVADTGPPLESDTLDLSQVTTNLVFNVATGALSVTFPSTGNVLTAANAFENVLSGSDDDLVNFVGVATLPAGATLDGGGGRNTLDYSAYTVGIQVNLSDDPLVTPAIGPHTATGASSIVRFRDVIGSNQADVIVGDQLGNNLSGLGGNDTLYGGRGADVLAGGNDSDDLYGGPGDDRYVLTPGFTGVTLTEFNGIVSAGQATAGGVDTIDISALTITLPIDISSDIEFENIIGSLTVRNVLTGNVKDNLLVGGAAGDKIFGGDGNDFLIGQGGNDWLEGGAGDDILHGGTGADGVGLDIGLQRLFLGGPGRDVLIGGDDADTINADDNEEDIVVSGVTAYDNVGVDSTHLSAWLEIRDVWASTTRDRAFRQALIAAGVGTGSIGGPFSLSPLTVVDDGDSDTLIYDSTTSGSPVDDLVFSDFGDTLTASLISGDSIADLAFAIAQDVHAEGSITPIIRSQLTAQSKKTSTSAFNRNLLLIQNDWSAMAILDASVDDPQSPTKRQRKTEESSADGAYSTLRGLTFDRALSDWGSET